MMPVDVLQDRHEDVGGDAGDVLRCIACGTEGIGIGFAHDCALIFRVAPNDDEVLDCLLCGGQRRHVPRPLCVTFRTPSGTSTCGLHRDCYDRARVAVRGPVPAEQGEGLVARPST